MKSIKGKLILMYMGLVLIVMIVCGTYILVSLQNTELDRARQQMKLYTEKISEQVVGSYAENDFQNGIVQFGENGSNTAQIQGSIINTEGETIATTASSKAPYTQYKSSAVISALSGNEAFSKNDNTGTERFLEYASPVFINGVVKYVIFTRMDASEIYSSIGQTQRTIVFSVLIAFLMAAIMGYIFANTITGPILSLSSKAKELAKGRLDQSVKVLSNDEIGQLSESFNFMAKELSNTLSEISKEKNKMEIILQNMTDGVLLFDKDGNVIHCNSTVLEMLGIEKADKNLETFMNTYGLSSGVYIDVIENESTQKVNFWLGKKFINASFSPYLGEKHSYEGVVVVLQDNTEMKRLDDMRKEFVANVSHELRTPLTTVKSYTETLLDGAIEDKETATEFLDIINNEADRMSFLVRDLLQLSRFDNGQIEFNYTDIDVNDFIAENIRQCRIHAENKKQTLCSVQSEKPLFVTADHDRITQVLNNIITNAIKYSPEGSKIEVWADDYKDYVRICVKDNGMGISKEDLPRIFERFYRVDKARSRAMGGTGLGLAIAKEIMERHGGKITAESELLNGTKMILWFPKKNSEIKVKDKQA